MRHTRRSRRSRRTVRRGGAVSDEKMASVMKEWRNFYDNTLDPKVAELEAIVKKAEDTEDEPESTEQYRKAKASLKQFWKLVRSESKSKNPVWYHWQQPYTREYLASRPRGETKEFDDLFSKINHYMAKAKQLAKRLNFNLSD